MTKRWDVHAYTAALPNMPLAELCARLRGEYADVSYGEHPLHAEAARRLEAMQAEIERLEKAADELDTQAWLAGTD